MLTLPLTQARLGRAEAMIILEHERERPKEQIEYAKQNCGEYAQVQALQHRSQCMHSLGQN